MKNRFKMHILVVLFMGLFLVSSISMGVNGVPPVGISSEARIPTTDPIDKDTSITFQCDAKPPLTFPRTTVDWVRMYYKVNAGSWYYTAMTLDAYITYKVTKTSVQLGADYSDTIYWYCKMKDSNSDYYTGDTFDYDTLAGDPTAPSITNLIEYDSAWFDYTANVEVTCDVTDEVEVDRVEFRYSIGWDSWSSWLLGEYVSDDEYKYDFDISDYEDIPEYIYYQVRAYDTSENLGTYSFNQGAHRWRTTDLIAPTITGHGCSSLDTRNEVFIWMTATDNYGINVAECKVTYADSTDTGYLTMDWNSGTSRYEETVDVSSKINPTVVNINTYITSITFKAQDHYQPLTTYEWDYDDIHLYDIEEPNYHLALLYDNDGGWIEANGYKGTIGIVYVWSHYSGNIDDVTMYVDLDDDGSEDWQYTHDNLDVEGLETVNLGFVSNATDCSWIRFWCYITDDDSNGFTTSVFRIYVNW